MEISCYSSTVTFKEIVIHIYNRGYIHWLCPNSNLLVLDLDSDYVIDALLRKDQIILDALNYLTQRRHELKIITEFNNPSSQIIDVVPYLVNKDFQDLVKKIEFTLYCDLSTDTQKTCALEVKEFIQPIIQRKEEKRIKALAIKQRRREFQILQPQILLFLIERDGHKCRICNSIENIQVDHIVPLSKGGIDDALNLQLLCRYCNSSKGDKN